MQVGRVMQSLVMTHGSLGERLSEPGAFGWLKTQWLKTQLILIWKQFEQFTQ